MFSPRPEVLWPLAVLRLVNCMCVHDTWTEGNLGDTRMLLFICLVFPRGPSFPVL